MTYDWYSATQRYAHIYGSTYSIDFFCEDDVETESKKSFYKFLNSDELNIIGFRLGEWVRSPSRRGEYAFLVRWEGTEP